MVENDDATTDILYTYPKVAVAMCKSLSSSENWLVLWHDAYPMRQIRASHTAQVFVGQRHAQEALSFPPSFPLHPFQPQNRILLLPGACSKGHAWHRCYLSLHRNAGQLYHAATVSADSRMLCMLHPVRRTEHQTKGSNGTSIM